MQVVSKGFSLADHRVYNRRVTVYLKEARTLANRGWLVVRI